MSDKTVNLIENRDVTVRLLADTQAWRVRVVEEITVDAATTCLRRRSLQVAPLREHLSDLFEEDPNDPYTHALLALFVAPIRRGPLMDFDVSGPDGDEASLLPRSEIARRQALYLENLALECGYPLTDELRVLLVAILGFTGQWLASSDVNTKKSFEYYIQDGLDRRVPADTLAAWTKVGDACWFILRERLDVFRGYSAPENPALVLPELFDAKILPDDATATEWLNQYLDLLETLHSISETSTPEADPAETFLESLADYANYYDLIVAMRVPLDEPFLVKYAERRDLKLGRFLNKGSQELVLADAQSNHVTFKVTDPNIWISGAAALMPGSEEFSASTFPSRSSQQTRSFYAHADDRDYRIRVSFRLAPLPRLEAVPYFAAVLLLLLSWALWDARRTDLDLRTLALIAGPAALAASVLLAREPSTLGSRLRLLSSLFLGSSLVILVATAVVLYVNYIRWP